MIPRISKQAIQSLPWAWHSSALACLILNHFTTNSSVESPDNGLACNTHGLSILNSSWRARLKKKQNLPSMDIKEVTFSRSVIGCPSPELESYWPALTCAGLWLVGFTRQADLGFWWAVSATAGVTFLLLLGDTQRSQVRGVAGVLMICLGNKTMVQYKLKKG